MRDFNSLDTHDWQQIAAAANGQISGTLDEWPHLRHAIDKTGVVLTGDTPHRELKWCCEALYWQNRADEFALSAGAHAEVAYNLEGLNKSLIAEKDRLKVENSQLRDALKLELAYASRPENPAPPVDRIGE